MSWEKTVRQFNNGQRRLSSEKSLVFWFAWNLKLELGDIVKEVDFERNQYDSFSDGTFLDLYLELDNQDQTYRVGIEFKFPHNNGGNTNQTQTRQKCINDLKRLSWLVDNQKIDLGVFLMATNEGPYIAQGTFGIAKEFKTSNGTKYQRDQLFPSNESYPESVKTLDDIEFRWNNFAERGSRALIPDGQVAWIEPIQIKRLNNQE
ncbi:MAG: hypothetical protein H6602_01255 [Flavobacteriales bacterium]|nr:hypothetical protein [Flavobacteriales bacterium]